MKVWKKVLVAESCPTLCEPKDCSPPGSSVHGILQARILEWVAIPFSRGFSWPRAPNQVSCIAGRFFTIWATREGQKSQISSFIKIHCRSGGSEVKASAWSAWDLGSIPGLGRSPGEGNGNPLQYSWLENPRDGGAWWGYSPQGHKESDTTSLSLSLSRF